MPTFGSISRRNIELMRYVGAYIMYLGYHLIGAVRFVHSVPMSPFYVW